MISNKSKGNNRNKVQDLVLQPPNTSVNSISSIMSISNTTFRLNFTQPYMCLQ